MVTIYNFYSFFVYFCNKIREITVETFSLQSIKWMSCRHRNCYHQKNSWELSTIKTNFVLRINDVILLNFYERRDITERGWKPGQLRWEPGRRIGGREPWPLSWRWRESGSHWRGRGGTGWALWASTSWTMRRMGVMEGGWGWSVSVTHTPGSPVSTSGSQMVTLEYPQQFDTTPPSRGYPHTRWRLHQIRPGIGGGSVQRVAGNIAAQSKIIIHKSIFWWNISFFSAQNRNCWQSRTVIWSTYDWRVQVLYGPSWREGKLEQGNQLLCKKICTFSNFIPNWILYLRCWIFRNIKKCTTFNIPSNWSQSIKEVKSLLTHCTYLEDESLHLMGIKFYGSPWQPRFSNSAFNLTRGRELRSVWDKIPSDTDVLITHSPPLGVLDLCRKHTADGGTKPAGRCGCEDLLRQVVGRIRPRYQIFGHVHECKCQDIYIIIILTFTDSPV